jgi:hypothetical protein
MSAHPSNYKLEGHAAGDHDPEVAQHLVACEPCRTYVERSVKAGEADPVPLPAFLTANGAASRPDRPVRGRVVRLALGIAPLAAAAAFALFMHHPAIDPGAKETPGAYATQFKGGLQLAVIRDREGDQERFAARVPVRAHDRLRVEVAIDRERPVTVGLLAEDGSWLTLLAPALLGPGAHFSERAASVDEHPTNGVILAGEPAAIERARATRIFDDVTAMTVSAEP